MWHREEVEGDRRYQTKVELSGSAVLLPFLPRQSIQVSLRNELIRAYGERQVRGVMRKGRRR